MLKLFTKTLLASLLALLVVGCGSSNNELDGLNENDYKIVKERLDFEKAQNAYMNFDIDKDTDDSLTLLLDAHVKIMYKINLKGQKKNKVKNVLHIDLTSNDIVHLDKLLLEKKDYYFDSVNNAVYVAITIPYLYLLDKNFEMKLSLSMATTKRQLVRRTINMRYETAPMADNNEDYMSFKYVKNFEADNIDPFILSLIKKELEHANISAFDDNYIKRHQKIFNGDN
jgi:hypothetical protein